MHLIQYMHQYMHHMMNMHLHHNIQYAEIYEYASGDEIESESESDKKYNISIKNTISF